MWTLNIEDMVNPFVGSKVVVKEFFMEDELKVPIKDLEGEKEDENERFLLFKDGRLIRKTKSAISRLKNN